MDFRYEVNQEGVWQPALLLGSHDTNNKSFAVLNTGDGTWSVTPTIPFGIEAGNWRSRTT